MRGEVNGVSLFFDTEGSKLVQRGKVHDWRCYLCRFVHLYYKWPTSVASVISMLPT
jgi:hypothetical protein